MKTLVQRLETLLTVSPMSDFDRQTFSSALELARAEAYRVSRETEKEENLKGAREQALAQMASVSGMVAALECDYDRLQELREELQALSDAFDEAEDGCKPAANADLLEWLALNAEELQTLSDAAGDYENEDAARERIQEDPLDISVRSDWQNIGETLTPSEFTILLCTGGPAVRIVGELDQHNEPSRAWIEYQDWFTPWTELVDGVSHSDLLTYCQQFYFGEHSK